MLALADELKLGRAAENALLDEVSATSDAAGRCETRGDPPYALCHGHRLSDLSRQPRRGQLLSRQTSSATRHLDPSRYLELVPPKRHHAHRNVSGKRLLGSTHTAVGYRAHRAVQHGAVRNELDHRCVRC